MEFDLEQLNGIPYKLELRIKNNSAMIIVSRKVNILVADKNDDRTNINNNVMIRSNNRATAIGIDWVLKTCDLNSPIYNAVPITIDNR